MDRWEDADDDVQSCKQKGKVARLGIAGFVRAAVAGEQEQQQQQSIVIVASKRAQRAAADRFTMPPPAPAAAAPAAPPALPRPAVPVGCVAPPAGVLLLVFKAGELLQQLPVTQVMTVFGRLPQNDVVLDHASISRQHAALCFQAQQPQHGLQAILMDLGSAHGTFVEGTRLAKGQHHPLQPGDSIQFGGSTRAYKLHLPVLQQEAIVKKRGRVVFADSVEEEGAQEGSGSSSQVFKQKRKLEEVIGYSDGKHFTRVGPQAVSRDSQEQGQFAHLLQASQVIFQPAKAQQQQQQQQREEHRQGQEASQQQQQQGSEGRSHEQQSGNQNPSDDMQRPVADAGHQQPNDQQQQGSTASVQQLPDAEGHHIIVVEQQELTGAADQGAGAAAAVIAQSGADAVAKQLTPEGSSMPPAGLKSQGSLTRRWSAGAAALLPPQLRKPVASSSSEHRQPHQAPGKPQQEAAGGRPGSSSLYEQLPAAKPVN